MVGGRKAGGFRGSSGNTKKCKGVNPALSLCDRAGRGPFFSLYSYNSYTVRRLLTSFFRKDSETETATSSALPSLSTSLT
jgi:hypothetical protein